MIIDVLVRNAVRRSVVGVCVVRSIGETTVLELALPEEAAL